MLSPAPEMVTVCELHNTTQRASRQQERDAGGSQQACQQAWEGARVGPGECGCGERQSGWVRTSPSAMCQRRHPQNGKTRSPWPSSKCLNVHLFAWQTAPLFVSRGDGEGRLSETNVAHTFRTAFQSGTTMSLSLSVAEDDHELFPGRNKKCQMQP